MSTCYSCGGVIGRDCFNPMECAIISAREESYYRQQAETANMTVEGLQKKFLKLVSILEKNGVDLSELYEPEIEHSPVYVNEDPTLPF